MITNLKFIAIAIAILLTFGMTFALSQPSSMTTQTHVDSFRIDGIQRGTQVEPAAASIVTPDRSGYWAQVVRSASVRMSPGGPEVKNGFRLQPGQYFHVETKGGNASWALGFACPNGGRYCNSRENLQGFILRGSLGARVSANASEPDAKATLADFTDIETDFDSSPDAASFIFAKYISPNRSERSVTVSAATMRTVCDREVWVRNNQLHPIGILRKGDRFKVERYTDGSGNSGKPVWALGWAYGAGVIPRGAYGRVMVASLCR